MCPTGYNIRTLAEKGNGRNNRISDTAAAEEALMRNDVPWIMKTFGLEVNCEARIAIYPTV